MHLLLVDVSLKNKTVKYIPYKCIILLKLFLQMNSGFILTISETGKAWCQELLRAQVANITAD